MNLIELKENILLNKYLEKFKRELSGNDWMYTGYFDCTDYFTLRNYLCDQFAWAVPNNKALDLIASYNPIIEVGAGRGYWSALLKQRGADVVAFDKDPPYKLGVNNWHQLEGMYFKVQEAEASITERFSDRTLFICWPPLSTSMALQALKSYTGETVIYIGEGEGGCTGNDEFHRKLESDFVCVKVMDIPQWSGIHDFLRVYHRI